MTIIACHGIITKSCGLIVNFHTPEVNRIGQSCRVDWPVIVLFGLFVFKRQSKLIIILKSNLFSHYFQPLCLNYFFCFLIHYFSPFCCRSRYNLAYYDVGQKAKDSIPITWDGNSTLVFGTPLPAIRKSFTYS